MGTIAGRGAPTLIIVHEDSSCGAGDGLLAAGADGTDGADVGEGLDAGSAERRVGSSSSGRGSGNSGNSGNSSDGESSRNDNDNYNGKSGVCCYWGVAYRLYRGWGTTSAGRVL